MNIELRRVSKCYGETHALRGLDLVVNDPVNVLVFDRSVRRWQIDLDATAWRTGTSQWRRPVL
jgi:hypothetical protein